MKLRLRRCEILVTNELLINHDTITAIALHMESTIKLLGNLSDQVYEANMNLKGNLQSWSKILLRGLHEGVLGGSLVRKQTAPRTFPLYEKIAARIHN